MREVLVLDAGLPETDYAALLGLPPGTEVLRMTGALSRFSLDGPADRAVFIPNFRQGGPHPYQIALINESRSVGSWIVYAPEAEASIVMQYKARLSDAALLFTEAEEAKAALRGAVMERNSCLLLSLHPDAPAAAVEGLLRQDLAYWRLSSAPIGPSRAAEEALAAFPAAQLALIGRSPQDFDGVSWPVSHMPYFVLACGGMAVSDARREKWVSQLASYAPGAPASRVYVVYPVFEQWRRDVFSGVRDPLSLKTESLFCMRDAFGLPQAPAAYQDADAVRACLSRYDGIQALAKDLKKER